MTLIYCWKHSAYDMIEYSCIFPCEDNKQVSNKFFMSSESTQRLCVLLSNSIFLFIPMSKSAKKSFQINQFPAKDANRGDLQELGLFKKYSGINFNILQILSNH